MKSNRSIPQATVIPLLIYPDVRDAVDSLGQAFGFVERVRIGEDHRSQLSFGDGALIVGDVGGERQYTAEDPAGHQWTFSETLADVSPEEWGGTLAPPPN